MYCNYWKYEQEYKLPYDMLKVNELDIIEKRTIYLKLISLVHYLTVLKESNLESTKEIFHSLAIIFFITAN